MGSSSSSSSSLSEWSSDLKGKFFGTGVNRYYCTDSSVFRYHNFEDLERRTRETSGVMWRNIIRRKILQEGKTKEILEYYGLDFETLITCLGDQEKFKNHFLKPQFNTIALLNEMKEEAEMLVKFEPNIDIKSVIEKMNERKKILSNSNFKFLLLSCKASENLLSRYIARHLNYEFGALHSAISIDGLVIEWGRGMCGSSIVAPLVDPRAMFGLLFSSTLITQDKDNLWANIKQSIVDFFNYITFGLVGQWYAISIAEEKLNKLAEICVYYNRSQTYNFYNCNCQGFVLKATKNMGLELEFEGKMQTVIEKLMRTGKTNLSFGNKNFETREELDDFVMGVRFRDLPECDRNLLFAYKNVFDEYLRMEPNNIKHKTSVEAEENWKRLLVEHLDAL